MRNKLILFSSILMLLFSCKNNQQITVEEILDLTPHQEENLDSVETEFNNKVNWKIVNEINQSEWIAGQLNNNEKLIIDSLHLFSKNLLPKLYAHKQNNLLWTSEKNIEDAYRALELAWLDGLQPEDYHLSKLKSIQKKILKSTSKEEKSVWISRHDIILTDAIVLYSFHLLTGKIDPVELDNNWNYDNRTISRETLLQLFQFLKDEKILEGLDQLRPSNPSYRAMMNAMLFYHNYKDNEWAEINGFEKLEVGDTNHFVPQIRKRLSLCCQSNAVVTDSMVFDSTLLKEVVYFQKQHGLDDDGVIGKQTVELLNLTPQQRIDKLKANLERLRWLPNDVGDYVVEVNIAAFKLYLKENGKLIHECKVMTGKPYHKTPIFKDEMEYIDFNPTWTVPYSIATKETLPRLKKEGAAYLDRNNMELLNSSGKAINAHNVDFNSLSVGNFPYVIRQKPGPGNALGVVKFMFPNQYSVYLHDTQSKALFSRSSRAFSHGCIRVENPLELAEILLDDKKRWDRDKIDKVVDSRKTTTVNLKKDVDVMLLYYTAGLFPDGTLFYLPDVYKRDQTILELLDAPFIYDEKTHQRAYQNRDSVALDTITKF